MITFEYGAVSSKFSVQAENKLTAYAAMIVHYEGQAGLLVIYSPEESKKDCWTTFGHDVMEKVDKTFGGPGAFEKYIREHTEEINKAYGTIKRIV